MSHLKPIAASAIALTGLLAGAAPAGANASTVFRETKIHTTQTYAQIEFTTPRNKSSYGSLWFWYDISTQKRDRVGQAMIIDVTTHQTLRFRNTIHANERYNAIYSGMAPGHRYILRVVMDPGPGKMDANTTYWLKADT